MLQQVANVVICLFVCLFYCLNQTHPFYRHLLGTGFCLAYGSPKSPLILEGILDGICDYVAPNLAHALRFVAPYGRSVAPTRLVKLGSTCSATPPRGRGLLRLTTFRKISFLRFILCIFVIHLNLSLNTDIIGCSRDITSVVIWKMPTCNYKWKIVLW